MNKREQGKAYRVAALRALTRFGYASTRQLATAVWGNCTLSTRKMASRTIRWLLARGLVVERRDNDSVNGERLIALNAAGASWLADHGDPLPGGKTHARDWLRHAHGHRTACNSVFAAIAGSAADMNIGWTELEIRNGLAPNHLCKYKFTDRNEVAQTKIPDLLLKLNDHAEPVWVWVEVENNWRSDSDLAKLVDFMRAVHSRTPAPIESVWLVITAPGAKSIGNRVRRAMTHGPTSGYGRQFKERDARILAAHLRVWSLDHETLTLTEVPF